MKIASMNDLFLEQIEDLYRQKKRERDGAPTQVA